MEQSDTGRGSGCPQLAKPRRGRDTFGTTGYIIARSNRPCLWHKTRNLRDHRLSRYRRDGRGVPRAGGTPASEVSTPGEETRVGLPGLPYSHRDKKKFVSYLSEKHLK